MTVGDLYELGQVHNQISGDFNWWVAGATLLILGVMWIAHVSSGRSW